MGYQYIDYWTAKTNKCKCKNRLFKNCKIRPKGIKIYTTRVRKEKVQEKYTK